MREKLYTGLYGYMGAKNADAMNYVECFKRYNSKGERIKRIVDTNFGAGNIISASGDYSERISNDLDEEIAFLADYVSRPSDRMDVIKELSNIEVSEKAFLECKEYIKSCKSMEEGERERFSKDRAYKENVRLAACIWFTLLRSFSGNRRAFEKVHMLREPLESKLDLLDTFNGVKILNMDMLELLEEEKKYPDRLENTMYYLDPPYMENHACYRINQEGQEFHRKLVGLLEGIPYIMISGYDNWIYNEILCGRYGFYRYEISDKVVSLDLNASFRPVKTEVIWTSYPIIGPYKQ